MIHGGSNIDKQGAKTVQFDTSISRDDFGSQLGGMLDDLGLQRFKIYNIYYISDISDISDA